MTPAVRRRLVWRAVLIGVFGVAPALSYGALVDALDAFGAAGVMLGAVSGASPDAIAAVLLALALRVYLFVVVPGVVVYKLVLAAVLAVARAVLARRRASP